MTDLLSLDDAAARLPLPASTNRARTVRRLIREKGVPYVKVGRSVFLTEAQIAILKGHIEAGRFVEMQPPKPTRPTAFKHSQITAPRNLPRHPVVYFLAADSASLVKIGSASMLAKRLKGLATMSPVPLRLACYLRGGQVLERQLHKQFAEYRAHGEWFRHEGELAAFIERTHAEWRAKCPGPSIRCEPAP